LPARTWDQGLPDLEEAPPNCIITGRSLLRLRLELGREAAERHRRPLAALLVLGARACEAAACSCRSRGHRAGSWESRRGWSSSRSSLDCFLDSPVCCQQLPAPPLGLADIRHPPATSRQWELDRESQDAAWFCQRPGEG
jgi:hypothetical protein